MFVATILLVHMLGHESTLSKWGAGLYLSARLAYLLVYAAGVAILRSLTWNAAFVGIVLLLIAAIAPT